MNIDRIRELAAFLRTPEVAEHFNMSGYLFRRDPLEPVIGLEPVNIDIDSNDPALEGREAFLNECGTMACIAGWTTVLWGGGKVGWRGAYDFAADDDLSYFEAEKLFTPAYHCNSRTTPAQAADALDNLATTGRVMWRVTAEEV